MPRGIFSFARTPPTSLPPSPLASRQNSVTTIEGVTPERARRASMDRIKRSSISSLADLSKGKKKKTPVNVESSKNAGAWLEMTVESPPLTFFGSKTESTGALFAGLIKLHVTKHMTIQHWSAKLVSELTCTKPVNKDCHDCATKTSILRNWDIFLDPVALTPGEHQHPVNHLISGDFPATTRGALGSLEYHFYSTAITEAGETITCHQLIKIDRALRPSETPHRSKRIFPPTKLILDLEMPRIIHPTGDFPMHLRMNNVVTTNEHNLTRWRIRKCLWHMDEEMRIIFPACPKHQNLPGGDGKNILHDNTREIASGSLSDKWKCDYKAGDDGICEAEFSASLAPGAKVACDIDSGTGMTISHNLHVEMVIVEEFAPLKRPDQTIPTGNARVLKARFKLNVSERTGMGISWDQEMPPVYEDVPPSPPGYATMEDIEIDGLAGEGSNEPLF